MGRILALDVGEKTIGIAMSDESGEYAFPGKTIWRQEGYRRDMNILRELVEQEEISEIVVGMPFSMSGNRGVQAEKVARFIEALRRYVTVPIHEELTFLLVALRDGKLNSLKSGGFELSPDMSLQQIVDRLSHGGQNLNEIAVTIPEGYTLSQIGRTLQAKGVIASENVFDNAST